MNSNLPENIKITPDTLPAILNLCELIPGGFFIYYANGDQKLIGYNSYMLSLYGCKSNEEFEELTGNSFKGIVHPDDYDITEKSIKEQIENSTDKVDHVKYRYLKKDGSIGMMDDYGHLSSSDAFGEIFYVFVQDITTQYFADLENMENYSRVMALEDNFESLYDVEFESGKYKLFLKGQTFSDVINSQLVEHNEFFNDSHKNINVVVYPEDRERFIRVINRDYIKNALKRDNHFDFYYRLIVNGKPEWFRMRAVYKNATEKNLIVGIFNAEEEMAAKISAEQRRNELIVQMAGGVSSYIINTQTKYFRILTQNEYLENNYPDSEDFDTSFSRYIEKDVYEPDKKMVKASITLPKMISHLEKEDEYVVRYRDASTGKPRWYEMRAVKLSDNEILYGFTDRDDEIVRQLLYDKMRDGYFGLLYWNLDTGYVQIIKTAHPEVTGETNDVINYKELFERIVERTDGEEAAFAKRISDIDYIKKSFESEDTLYHIYKSVFFGNGKWINTTGQVLSRNSKGEPSILSIGFSLLDEDACNKEEAKLKLAESMEVVGGLASEYTVLYYVNLDTDSYVSYYLAERAGEISRFFDSSETFSGLTGKFSQSDLIFPDDAEEVRNFYDSAESIKEKLKDRKRLSLLFRRNYGGEFLWTECVIVKCEDESEEAHNVIVGCIEKDKEVKEREERLAEAAKANQLIENIASKYDLAYNVNLSDDTFKIIHLDKHIILGHERVFNTFTEVKEYFLRDIIHPADVDFMSRELDFTTIAQKASEHKAYTIEYRTLLSGVSNWNEMNVTQISEDNVAIGFALNDIEITKRHLQEKKFDEYIALFVVDLDTEMIKTVKAPPIFKTAKEGASAPYELAIQQYGSLYEGDVGEFFEQITNIENVKRQFVSSDKVSYSYKSSKLGIDRWIDITGYVILRHEDGTPALTTLGFSLSDALAAARQELQMQINEDMHMIGGLASGFETLYYVNIDEKLCKTFTQGGDNQTELKKIFIADDDVFEFFRRGGKSEDIHPDDRKFFTTLNKEIVRDKLSHTKRFHHRFRRKYKGEYKWCEMEAIKYEDADEKANAIAIGFASRDAEIRSEQAISDCFRIFGKEISPQESIDSLLALLGDFYGAERAYIFEFANNEIINNTYEWCAEGIEPMISKLQEVPYETIEGWVREFKRQGAFYMDALDSEHNTDETREILEMQGIDSLISAPIMREDEIVGFIGVDNPKKAKKNVEILKTVSVVSYSEILKRKENDEEHVTLSKLTDAFMSVYYCDFATDYMRTWKIDEEYKDAYGKTESYSVSMGGYVRENIAQRDRERCIEMTSPEYVLEQFKTKERFSIEMTDIMLGYERSFVFDYIKVNEDGTQFVVCCRDVTDTIEKEKEQQRLLEEARNAAEEANKSKTSFLFNMSHDIRTPMNAITGFTNMAKKYVDDKKRVIDYLDKIDTSGLQLLSLVNQVLEMARIESGRVELEENQINIINEFNSLVVVLSEQAKANGLHFRHSLANISHNNVLADQARMSSITLNITGNAMKYTPKGGNIDFRFAEIEPRKPGYATYVFTVEDTGIGMSEEYQKVLFEPFTREKSSTVSKIQGTGLGMSIVKELVDLMGGNIAVKSKIGEGTRFDITIDLKIDDGNSLKNTKVTEINFGILKGKKVLLVEDNELNREIACDILREEELIIEEADDGTTCIDMLKEKGSNYYDFILMDIQMPIMNGYDATKKIREMYPVLKAPIIALSANAFKEDRERSLAAGMDEHISKPIKIKELFRTLSLFAPKE